MTVNRNQILLIVLILALAVNTISHFVHPAYRKYSEVEKYLRESNRRFRDDFVNEFFPVLTNIVNRRSSAFPHQASYTNGFSIIAEKSETVEKFESVDAHFCVVSGDSGFMYHGFFFRSGDLFLGSPIIGLDKTSFLTAAGRYILKPPPSDKDKSAIVPSVSDSVSPSSFPN